MIIAVDLHGIGVHVGAFNVLKVKYFLDCDRLGFYTVLEFLDDVVWLHGDSSPLVIAIELMRSKII